MTRKRDRVLLLFENDMYLRNFVLSGALDPVLEACQCSVAITDQPTKLVNKAAEHYSIDPGSIYRVPRILENIQRVYAHNRTSLLLFQHEAETFRCKAKHNWMPPPYTMAEVENSRRRRVSSGPKLSSSQWRFHSQQKAFRNDNLVMLLSKTKPDVVLYPFTGVEATGYELVDIVAARHPNGGGPRIVFLLNGWDNASSKGIFLREPDLMGAWGPGQRDELLCIQKCEADEVAELGCARYEPLLKAKRWVEDGNTTQRVHSRPYILVAGSTAPCDEKAVLVALSHAVTEAGLDLDIMYRPHPWAEKRIETDVDLGSLGHVIMDPQRDASWGARGVSSDSYPEHDRYAQILMQASGVVSPMSSVLVEAVLLGVPALALQHTGDPNRIGPDQIGKWTHFRHLDRLPPYAMTIQDELSTDKLASWLTYIDHCRKATAEHRREVYEEAQQALNAYILTRRPYAYGDRVLAALKTRGWLDG